MNLLDIMVGSLGILLVLVAAFIAIHNLFFVSEGICETSSCNGKVYGVLEADENKKEIEVCYKCFRKNEVALRLEFAPRAERPKVFLKLPVKF